MNYLIGRLKGKNGEYLRILSSKKSIYEKPEYSAANYEPDYKLEEDEWFIIEKFSQSSYCLDILKNPFRSTDLNQIKPAEYQRLSFLLAVESETYFFQKITPSQILSKKWFTIGSQPKLESSPIVLVSSMPDALYDKANDALYFFKLSAISSIFPGIEELHREATQPEVDDFFGYDLFQFATDYTAEKVKKANRKRIAMVIERLQRLKANEKQEMLSYIKAYCTELEFDESSVKINNEEELKLVCFGLNERFFTTPFSHEKKIANSVLPV